MNKLPPPSSQAQSVIIDAIVAVRHGKPDKAAHILHSAFRVVSRAMPQLQLDILYYARAVIVLDIEPYLSDQQFLQIIKSVKSDPPLFSEPDWLRDKYPPNKVKQSTHVLDSENTLRVGEFVKEFWKHVNMGDKREAYYVLLKLMQLGIANYVTDSVILAEIDDIRVMNRRWLLQSFSLLQNGQVTQARDLARSSLDGFRRTGDQRGEADALHIFGRIEHETNNLDKAIEYYDQALALSRQSNHIDGIARVAHEKARVAAKRNDFLGAEEGFRYALDYYVQRQDENNLQAAINQLSNLADQALLLPDSFIPALEASGMTFKYADEFVQIKALAIMAEVSEKYDWFMKRLIQKGFKLRKQEPELSQLALVEARRTARFRSNAFVEQVAEFYLNTEPKALDKDKPTIVVCSSPILDQFGTPDTAANSLQELLEFLKSDEVGNSYIYRGQTQDYSGPLLPSAYRKDLGESDIVLDASDPLYAYSLRKCGRKFYGEYNAKFLSRINSLSQMSYDVYHKVLNDFGIAHNQRSALLHGKVLSREEVLQHTLSPLEFEIYQANKNYWQSTIDDYDRRIIRTEGLYTLFGFLLGTALAQQFGLYSQGLDATRSLDVAAFFASHSSRESYNSVKDSGIGVIYRFPYETTDIRYRPVFDYTYPTLPSIVDMQDVLYRFEKPGLGLRQAMDCFECYFGAVHLDNICDVDLFFLPEGALELSRITRQAACIILPDELRKDREEGEPSRDGTRLPEFQYIEDLSSREGVHKFYFRHTGQLPKWLTIRREDLWPRDDPLLEILVQLITAIYPLGRFSPHFIIHRLDLIDGGYDETGFLHHCESLALKRRLAAYDYQAHIGANMGNLIL